MPLQKVEDLADTTLAQKIAPTAGRRLVTISAVKSRRSACRPTQPLRFLWFEPRDLRTSLAAANVDQAKGNIDGPRQLIPSAPTIRS